MYNYLGFFLRSISNVEPFRSLFDGRRNKKLSKKKTFYLLRYSYDLMNYSFIPYDYTLIKKTRRFNLIGSTKIFFIIVNFLLINFLKFFFQSLCRYLVIQMFKYSSFETKLVHLYRQIFFFNFITRKLLDYAWKLLD